MGDDKLDDTELDEIRSRGSWRLSVLSLRLGLVGIGSAALMVCAGLLGLRGWPLIAWVILSFGFVGIAVLGNGIAVVMITSRTSRYAGIAQGAPSLRRSGRLLSALVRDLIGRRS